MKIAIKIKVFTGSPKSDIVGERDGTLLIKLKSAPENNRANIELIKLIKKRLDISYNDIQIISGRTSKTKYIEILNLDKITFENLLKGQKKPR